MCGTFPEMLESLRHACSLCRKRFRLKGENSQKSAPCEDRTHDLQISNLDYETDALPTALTRHLKNLP